MVKTSAYINKPQIKSLKKRRMDTTGSIKRMIVACPVGQDPVDVMTRFCMTEKDHLSLSGKRTDSCNLTDKEASGPFLFSYIAYGK